jgi:perosamine synthetase
MQQLAKQKIGTRPLFLVYARTACLQKMGLFQGKLIRWQNVSPVEAVYLPSGMALTNEQIEHVLLL